MPLHLLGKKSWNVYNKSNIERVRHDEAEAEARAELRAKEDTARRLAVLRGERPPSPPPEDSRKRDRDRDPDRDKTERGERKRRRRLQGEDDTARDIRLARLDQAQPDPPRTSNRSTTKRADAPITDSDGHIQLFSAAPASTSAPPKKHGVEDGKGMRFQDAAGYNAPSQPWYTSSHTTADSHPASMDPKSVAALSAVEEKDLWGNSDPRRKAREHTRIVSSDPFALMQNAQKQLKQSEVDKEKWKYTQAKALKELDRKNDRRSRGGPDEFGNFSLDDPDTSKKERERSHHRRRRHHHRSRSRERDGPERRHRSEREPRYD